MYILVYRWNSYNYIDIIATFQTMGHQVDVIERELESYDEDDAFAARLHGILQQKNYDFVFTVNYFAVISGVCQQMGIKYVSWSCDSPLLSMYHKNVFLDCNYFFLFDKTNYLEFKGMGVKHIWHLPLAVDTDRLDELFAQDTADERNNVNRRYIIDKTDSVDEIQLAETDSGNHTKNTVRNFVGEISFVGNLYEKNSYDELEKRFPEYLRGYFDAVMEAQLNISGGNIIEPMLTADILERVSEYFELKKSKDSFSDLGLVFATTVLGFKTASLQRQRALLALAAKFPVNLYTNTGGDTLLRVKNCGSVDYWSEMPKVFRYSKINLNFTIPNIKSGLPLRIFDVLGAGGFLLTNYQAELPAYFEIGKDLACFESETELVEKCSYYLTHEEERQQIARSGYEKVKNCYSYRNRLEFILEKIKEG